MDVRKVVALSVVLVLVIALSVGIGPAYAKGKRKKRVTPRNVSMELEGLFSVTRVRTGKRASCDMIYTDIPSAYKWESARKRGTLTFRAKPAVWKARRVKNGFRASLIFRENGQRRIYRVRARKRKIGMKTFLKEKIKTRRKLVCKYAFKGVFNEAPTS